MKENLRIVTGLVKGLFSPFSTTVIYPPRNTEVDYRTIRSGTGEIQPQINPDGYLIIPGGATVQVRTKSGQIFVRDFRPRRGRERKFVGARIQIENTDPPESFEYTAGDGKAEIPGTNLKVRYFEE